MGPAALLPLFRRRRCYGGCLGRIETAELGRQKETGNAAVNRMEEWSVESQTVPGA